MIFVSGLVGAAIGGGLVFVFKTWTLDQISEYLAAKWKARQDRKAAEKAAEAAKPKP